MPRDDTGIGIEPAARRQADDQANRLSLVKTLLRQNCGGLQTDKRGKAKHEQRTTSGPRHKSPSGVNERLESDDQSLRLSVWRGLKQVLAAETIKKWFFRFSRGSH
jgi:hypothetical protein